MLSPGAHLFSSIPPASPPPVRIRPRPTFRRIQLMGRFRQIRTKNPAGKRVLIGSSYAPISTFLPYFRIYWVTFNAQ